MIAVDAQDLKNFKSAISDFRAVQQYRQNCKQGNFGTSIAGLMGLEIIIENYLKGKS